jgi:hypothetical protein
MDDDPETVQPAANKSLSLGSEGTATSGLTEHCRLNLSGSCRESRQENNVREACEILVGRMTTDCNDFRGFYRW